MKKAWMLLAVAVLFTSVGRATSHAQSPPPSTEDGTSQSPSTPSLRPDSGSVAGNVYRNFYFGFTYTFPAGWRVITPDHSSPKAPSETVTAYQLLFVTEPRNLFEISVVMLNARKLSSPTITARDVLVSQYPATKRSHFKRRGSPEQLTIDGRDFWAMAATKRVAGHTLREDEIATILKGYSLTFDLLSNTETTYTVLKKTVQSISFTGSNASGLSGNKPLAGSAAKVEPGPTNKQRILASGNLTGNVYRNSFFGLSYTLPAGLRVESQPQIQQVASAGHQLIYGNPAATDPEHRAAMKHDIFLVDAVETAHNPLTAPSQIVIMVEDLSAYPGMTAKQFMIQLAFGTEGSPLHPQPTAMVREKRYGATRFAEAGFIVQVFMRGHLLSAYVTYLAAISRGYAVAWIVSASSKSKLKALLESLKSVALAP